MAPVVLLPVLANHQNQAEKDRRLELAAKFQWVQFAGVLRSTTWLSRQHAAVTMAPHGDNRAEFPTINADKLPHLEELSVRERAQSSSASCLISYGPALVSSR